MLECIFEEIIAIAEEFTSSTSKNTSNSTSKIAKFTSILLRNDKKTSFTLFVQIFFTLYIMIDCKLILNSPIFVTVIYEKVFAEMSSSIRLTG